MKKLDCLHACSIGCVPTIDFYLIFVSLLIGLRFDLIPFHGEQTVKARFATVAKSVSKLRDISR